MRKEQDDGKLKLEANRYAFRGIFFCGNKKIIWKTEMTIKLLEAYLMMEIRMIRNSIALNLKDKSLNLNGDVYHISLWKVRNSTCFRCLLSVLRT